MKNMSDLEWLLGIAERGPDVFLYLAVASLTGCIAQELRSYIVPRRYTKNNSYNFEE